MCSGGRQTGSNHCKTTAFQTSDRKWKLLGEEKKEKNVIISKKVRKGEREEKKEREECCFALIENGRGGRQRRLAVRERRKQEMKVGEKEV